MILQIKVIRMSPAERVLLANERTIAHTNRLRAGLEKNEDLPSELPHEKPTLISLVASGTTGFRASE